MSELITKTLCSFKQNVSPENYSSNCLNGSWQAAVHVSNVVKTASPETKTLPRPKGSETKTKNESKTKSRTKTDHVRIQARAYQEQDQEQKKQTKHFNSL